MLTKFLNIKTRFSFMDLKWSNKVVMVGEASGNEKSEMAFKAALFIKLHYTVLWL